MNTEISIPKAHWRVSSLFVSVGMLLSSVAPNAAPAVPLWWQDRGVINSELNENNQAVANLGQAKWMASQALAELQTVAPDLAANIDLTQVFPTPPSTPDAVWYEAQKVPLNLGQLKSISHQFYESLPPVWLADQAQQNGITPWVAPYPWGINTPVSENLKLANIGQLKSVFSLRFRQDQDNSGAGDGLPDVWEIEHFGSLDETADGDADNDGYTNGEEQTSGSNPNDPSDGNTNPLDTDGDGADDDVELATGADPNDPQSIPENRIYFEYRYTETVKFGETKSNPPTEWSESRTPINIGKTEVNNHSMLAGVHYSRWYNTDNKWEKIRRQTVEIRLVQLVRNSAVAERALLKSMTGSYGENFEGLHSTVMPIFFDGEGRNIAEILTLTIGSGERYSKIVSVTPDDIPNGELQVLAGNSKFSESCGENCANYVTGYSLLPVDIVPDYNRDGQIDVLDRGKVTKDQPFRWWVNDDNDESVFHDSASFNKPSQSDGNHTDLVVNGESDFVDFFALELGFSEVLKMFPETEYTYKLSHTESALNFFEAEDLSPISTDVDTGPVAFLKANSWIQARSEKQLKPITPTGVELTNSFLTKLKKGEALLLCEAIKSTEEPLILLDSNRKCTASVERRPRC